MSGTILSHLSRGFLAEGGPKLKTQPNINLTQLRLKLDTIINHKKILIEKYPHKMEVMLSLVEAILRNVDAMMWVRFDIYVQPQPELG